MRPDFLVIGFAKTGTTTVYDRLAAHPVVAPALCKEVHFFDYKFAAGPRWYGAHFPPAHRQRSFQRAHSRPFLTGEASPSYVDHPLAAERVRAMLPDVRLIVLLRNPVDRAYSHYQMSWRNAEEDLPTFEAALDAEEGRLAGECERVRAEPGYRSMPLGCWSYLRRGRYAEHLEPWLHLFPSRQLLLLLTEDLEREWTGTWARIFAFLELPDHEPGPVERLYAGRYAPMAPATRARLVDYYAPHNARLRELVGLDPGWTG